MKLKLISDLFLTYGTCEIRRMIRHYLTVDLIAINFNEQYLSMKYSFVSLDLHNKFNKNILYRFADSY